MGVLYWFIYSDDGSVTWQVLFNDWNLTKMQFTGAKTSFKYALVQVWEKCLFPYIFMIVNILVRSVWSIYEVTRCVMALL